MRREDVKELRTTEEEVRLIMANRRKRRIKYLKKMRREKRFLRFKRIIANKLYPIPQRLGGIAFAIGGATIYHMAATVEDGELAFAGVFLLLAGLAATFTKENMYDM